MVAGDGVSYITCGHEDVVHMVVVGLLRAGIHVRVYYICQKDDGECRCDGLGGLEALADLIQMSPFRFWEALQVSHVDVRMRVTSPGS